MDIEDDIKPYVVRNLEYFIGRFWWVFLFALSCLFVYEQGQRAIRHDDDLLSKKLDDLKLERKIALVDREDMIRQLNSQSDHDWMELTLMKGLGLVPEGQRKVYFSNE